MFVISGQQSARRNAGAALPTTNLIARWDSRLGVETVGGGGADANDVTAWVDQVRGIRAEPDITGDRPTLLSAGWSNGLPSLAFGSEARLGPVSSLLLNTDLSASATDVSIYIITKHVNDNTGQYLFDCNSGRLLLVPDDGTGRAGFRGPAGWAYGDPPVGGEQCISFVGGSATGALYVERSERVTGAYSSPALAGATRFGTHNDSVSNPFNGEIAAVYVYSVKHNAAQRAAVWNHVSALWGVANFGNFREFFSHWYDGSAVTLSGSQIATMVDQGVSGGPDLDNGTLPTYDAAIAELGGQPGGAFIAANSDYIRNNPAFASIPQPFTIVITCAADTLPTNVRLCGGSVGARWFIRHASVSGQMQLFAGAVMTVNPGIVTGVPLVIVAVFNGSSSVLRVNGVNYTGSSAGSGPCEDITLGREATAVYWDGPIPQAAVMEGDLINDEPELLAHVESYLNDTYNP